MKNIIALFIVLFFGLHLHAQEITRSIAEKACNCIESIKTTNPDSLETQLQQCISSSVAHVMLNSNPEIKKAYSTVEGIQQLVQLTVDELFQGCQNYRNAVINIKSVEFYSLSKNEDANKAYFKGNSFAEVKEYGAAINEYMKAIAIDSTFIFALDNTAICYRKISDFDNAEKYYQKSLKVFPEGDVALLNIAGIYVFRNKYDKALAYFKQLRFYHPHNAEGYFGIAKVAFQTNDYAESLENAFMAYRIYSENKSPYLEDSKKLIAHIYNKLKEENKLSLFTEKAKKYNISFEGLN